MYMCFIIGKNMPAFAEDAVYRFMKMMRPMFLNILIEE